MTLPLSRDITAVGGSAIPSNLANNVQDMIVGGRHGSEEWLFPATGGLEAIGAWSYNGLYVSASGAAQVLDLSLGKLPVGARITAANIYHRRFGGSLTFSLNVADLTGTFNENSHFFVSVSAGTADAVTNHVLVTPVVLPATSFAYIRFTSGANLDRFYGIGITFDH
jgi:hypothetical protein